MFRSESRQPPHAGAVRLAGRNIEAPHVHRTLDDVSEYEAIGEPRSLATVINRASEKADGMLIVAYEHPVVVDAVAQVARKIPVVTVASDLPDTGRLAYVGVDNRCAGRVAGELMGRVLGPEGGHVLVIAGLRTPPLRRSRLPRQRAPALPLETATEELHCGDRKASRLALNDAWGLMLSTARSVILRPMRFGFTRDRDGVAQVRFQHLDPAYVTA